MKSPISRTYQHTNIFEADQPKEPKQRIIYLPKEQVFRSSSRRIDVCDNEIFSPQVWPPKRQLKSVKVNDHSADYFYDRCKTEYSPRKPNPTEFSIILPQAQQRKDVLKITMDQTKSPRTPRVNVKAKMTTLTDWAMHDSVRYRDGQQSQRISANRPSNKLTQQITDCKRQLDILEGKLPMASYWKESFTSNANLYEWKKHYYRK